MTDNLITTVWARRPCPICHNGKCTILGRRSLRCPDENGQYVFEHADTLCSRCGFVYSSSVPADSFLFRYYTETIRKLEDDYNPEARVKLLRELAPPLSKVLEIGGKRTAFNERLAKEDYSVDIIEIGGYVPPEASYTAIVSYFVLEHVKNPAHFMVNIFHLLVDGGVAIIEVPNFETHTLHSMYREHLNHFTERHLRALFAIAGFENVRVHPDAASRPYGLVVSGKKLRPPDEGARLYAECVMKYGGPECNLGLP